MFAQFREKCPVAFTREKGGVWFLFNRADVMNAAKDTASFGSDVGDGVGPRRPPIELDPPDHTWFRRALQPHFSTASLERFNSRIESWSSELVATHVSNGGGDVIADIADVLPVRVLCEFLGFPPESWDAVKYWADQSSLYKWGDSASIARRIEADNELLGMAQGLIDQRLTKPRDPEEDVVSALIAANAASGDLYPVATLASTVQLMLTAGHGTTTAAIGNAIYRLAIDSLLQSRVRHDPDAVARAVEESLRTASPVATPRTALRDIEVNGRTIREGQRVWLVWGSANLDDTDQPGASRYAIDNEIRNLAFGYGIHKCIGLNLARSEIVAVVSRLLEETDSISLAGEVKWQTFPRYGISKLPISVETVQ